MRAKQLIFPAICFLGISVISNAQPKTGYVNSQKVIEAMPEFKLVNDTLDEIKEIYQKTLESMYGAYEKLQKGIEQLEPRQNTPDSIMEGKIRQIQELQQRIQLYEQKGTEELTRQQQERLKPVTAKYTAAMQQIAQAQGYSCIIDLSAGAVVYFTDASNEITGLVLSKLGISSVR